MKIPPEARSEPLSDLTLISQGKVRDRYVLPDNKCLVVATDRVSVHDVILPSTVPFKGVVLNLLDLWWRRTHLASHQYLHDVVASGRQIDSYLPESLRGNPDLHSRARVVELYDMMPFELIPRGHLAGTAWKQYRGYGARVWPRTARRVERVG